MQCDKMEHEIFAQICSLEELILVAESQSQSADAGQLGVDRFERKLHSL